jgi:hypothetical protein
MVDEDADLCPPVVSGEERPNAYEDHNGGHTGNDKGQHEQPDHPKTARPLVPDGLSGNGHSGIVDSRQRTFTSWTEELVLSSPKAPL